MINFTIITTTGTSIFTNAVSFINSQTDKNEFPIFSKYIQEVSSDKNYTFIND